MISTKPNSVFLAVGWIFSVLVRLQLNKRKIILSVWAKMLSFLSFQQDKNQTVCFNNWIRQKDSTNYSFIYSIELYKVQLNSSLPKQLSPERVRIKKIVLISIIRPGSIILICSLWLTCTQYANLMEKNVLFGILFNNPVM